jgi:Na+/phosphate symporter
MTVYQRIKKILFSLCMLGVALFFFLNPSDTAYKIVVAILSLGLASAGIKDIVFYFTMARHMVGGKMILIQGVIIFDFAIITSSLADVPKIYILMYLIGIHAFSGVIEILRANEARKTVDGPWKIKFSHGIVNLILAIACLIFIRKSNTALIIYSLGLMYSAVVRLFDAFGKTAFQVIE